jgi:RNA polymerase sigma factor (sigma-70 family)
MDGTHTGGSGAVARPFGRPGRPEEGRGSAAHAELVSALYRTNYVALCRTARLLVDDPSRAEELVQEAFTRTLSGARSLRQPDSALFYVRRAVVHACRSELRRRRIERRIGLGSGGGHLDRDGEVASGARFEDAIGEKDEIVRLLRLLTPRQREVVVLRYYADLDETAIAAAMGCSTGTVKSQLFKAKQRLSALLRPEPASRSGVEDDGADPKEIGRWAQ